MAAVVVVVGFVVMCYLNRKQEVWPGASVLAGGRAETPPEDDEECFVARQCELLCQNKLQSESHGTFYHREGNEGLKGHLF